MRHHFKHMIPCAVMLVALIALQITGIGAATAWLPALFLLACPLMMLTMMWGMRNTAADKADAHHH